MKKPLKIALIILGILFGIHLILVYTGMLKMYTIPTTGNEPGIKRNSMILVSNLIDFKNGDFVCYKYYNESLGEHVRVHRLLGKSGDVVEIENGIFYLNNENVDKNMELKHFYTLEINEFHNLLNKKLITKKDMSYQRDNKVYICLIDKYANLIGLSEKIKLEPKEITDKTIKAVYNNNWNLDNFGPLKIPNGKCFVIGDNRPNSADSRYIGLINESDIVGTVIKK